MQESIERLNTQPRAEKPLFDNNLNTWFLLDKVRGEKTLPAFYQGSNAGLIASIDYLLLGTEHAQLIEASPLLIKLNHTQLSDSLYKHIQQERSGIFIQASDENILPHLQYLFSMQSESDGAVYARYYDPIFWTALQLSLADQQQNIWGNLKKVYTLAPESRIDQLSFIKWDAPTQEINTIYTCPTTPIKLDHSFDEISLDIQLLGLLYQIKHQESLAITQQQTRDLLINLKIFHTFNISRTDHLTRLVKLCINQPHYSLQPEVQHILKQDIASYEKVQQLEQLA